MALLVGCQSAVSGSVGLSVVASTITAASVPEPASRSGSVPPVTTAGAKPATWTVEQLVKTSANEYHARIDGQYVVWNAFDKHFHQIYLHNLSTGKTTEITHTAGLHNMYPEVNGGHVLWQSFADGQPQNLVLYDIATKRTRTIAQGVDLQTAEPSMAGDLVVWQSKSGNEIDVYLYRISTGLTQRLTTEGTGGMLPRTDGRYVVWLQGRPSDEVVLFDASSGTTQSLGSYSLVGAPDISAGLVAWTTNDGQKGAVYLHDIASGITKQITTSAVSPSAPRVDKGLVVWREGTNGSPFEGALGSGQSSTTSSSSGRRILIYDQSTDHMVQVSANVAPDSQPQVKDGLVIWEAIVGQKQEPQVFDVATGQTATVAKSIEGLYPESASGDRVVWTGWAGGSFDVFLATPSS